MNELQAEDAEAAIIITGIAGKKDFTAIAHRIRITCPMKWASCARRFLSSSVTGVSIEHIPSGIDTFSIVVASRDVKDIIYDIINDIRREVHPDNIRVIR